MIYRHGFRLPTVHQRIAVIIIIIIMRERAIFGAEKLCLGELCLLRDV